MSPYWSYLLTAVGIFGIYLAGRKNLYGWAVGLGAQVLWIAYAISTEQWGFIVSAFAYGSVYARNWSRWAKENENNEQTNGFDSYKTSRRGG